MSALNDLQDILAKLSISLTSIQSLCNGIGRQALDASVATDTFSNQLSQFVFANAADLVNAAIQDLKAKDTTEASNLAVAQSQVEDLVKQVEDLKAQLAAAKTAVTPTTDPTPAPTV